MSLSNSAENNLLKLLYNNVTWAGVGDATGLVGSGAAGSFYLALHTANPGETGDQSTSEATFTSYARVAVARTTGGWTVTGNQASNTALVQFPQCTGGTNAITYVSVGKSSSGAGEIVNYMALNTPLTVQNLNTVEFPAGAIVLTAD
jgi:hypothetical protein